MVSLVTQSGRLLRGCAGPICQWPGVRTLAQAQQCSWVQAPLTRQVGQSVLQIRPMKIRARILRFMEAMGRIEL